MEKNKKQKPGFSIRTDLAIEATEMLKPATGKEAGQWEGVKMTVEENGEFEDIRVTSVEVLNEEGARQMGKPVGTYITLESCAMGENFVEAHEEISRILSEKFNELCHINEDSQVLIIGLGNWNITPDALGPKVVSKVLVTRHITQGLPEELTGHMGKVSAISPGVMGLTGLETGEVVQGLVDRVKPDLVICIDALAARKTNRINATIQMSNTGINPGAGVGNKRMSLNEASLGVPVVAIGVPTVVDAATLANDTIDRILAAMMAETGSGSEFYQMLKNLEEEEKYHIIQDILDPYAGNMFVTPKEVDAVIERLAKIIANALNIALHPGILEDDINRFLNA